MSVQLLVIIKILFQQQWKKNVKGVINKVLDCEERLSKTVLSSREVVFIFESGQ